MARAQRVELVDPRVGRPELAPRVDEGVDDAGPREVFALRVAGGSKTRVRRRQQLARLRRVVRQPAQAQEVAEPRNAVALRRGHVEDPLGQRLEPAARQQRRRLREHERHQARPVAGLAQQRDAGRSVAFGGQQSGRFAARIGELPRRQLAAAALEQEFAEQRVVLVRVAAAGTGVARNEEVSAIELGEQRGRVIDTGERRRRCRGEARQQRGAHEEPLQARFGLVEQLAGEVIEHQRLGRRAVVARRRGRPALQDQHEASGPALRARVQRAQRRVVGCAAGQALVGHLDEFVRAQAQRLAIEQREVFQRAQPCQRRRRLGAARHDDRQAGRYLGQPLAQRDVHRRVGGELVVVVEDQHRHASHPREEAAEPVAREHRQAGQVLGGEVRQRLGPAAAAHRRRLPEVVEERRDVAVGGVDPVPGGAQPACLQVAGDQRRLARTGGRGDPRDAARGARRVEPVEQPGPRPGAMGLRRGQLGQTERPLSCLNLHDRYRI